MQKKISEIIDFKTTRPHAILPQPLALVLPNPRLEEIKSLFWGTIAAKVLPDVEIVVTRIGHIHQDGIQLNYVDGKNENFIIVPANFMLEQPEGSKAEKILKKYEAYRAANLSRFISYHGSIGSDPEMFCEDKDGSLVPAFTFLPSKDTAPAVAGANGYNNKVYWDGFQAEFDTTPAGCMEAHVTSIRSGILLLHKFLKGYKADAKLSAKTLVDIEPEIIQACDSEHVAFGCMPSFNAYGMKGSELPGDQVYVRSAGGHIHFGMVGSDHKKLAKEKIVSMVKSLDAILGVACVSMFANFDSPRRRTMYGLAGEYRTPAHGFEYRVLSNAWMMHPLLANMVFDMSRGAAMMGYNDFMHYWQHDEAETIRIINECDVNAARSVLKKNMAVLRQVIGMKYPNDTTGRIDLVIRAIMEGAESVIAEPTNIEKNWALTNTNWYHNLPGNSVRTAVEIVKKGKKV